MRNGLIIMFALAACASGQRAAKAEAPLSPPPSPSAPAAQEGRFSMTPTQGGFLRLDKDTGAVSFCTVEGGLSLCRVSADERSALENEIARLRRENAELKSGRAGGATNPPSTLPKEEEFERALSFTERFIRRMMRVFKDEANGDKS
jgi:hypothetical protein